MEVAPEAAVEEEGELPRSARSEHPRREGPGGLPLSREAPRGRVLVVVVAKAGPGGRVQPGLTGIVQKTEAVEAAGPRGLPEVRFTAATEAGLSMQPVVAGLVEWGVVLEGAEGYGRTTRRRRINPVE